MTVDQIYLDKTITIGIPAHGNSKITKVCLDFLLKSTKGDFELILVDDYSQDNKATKELFLSIKQFHKNLKIYSFDKNKSQFGSMNCIFCTATGNKIIFLSNFGLGQRRFQPTEDSQRYIVRFSGVALTENRPSRSG